MDMAIPRSQDKRVAFPSLERLMPIIRASFVCGVLALALVSVMFLVGGAAAIPTWIQGLFAIGGIVVGAFLGVLRGSVA